MTNESHVDDLDRVATMADVYMAKAGSWVTAMRPLLLLTIASLRSGSITTDEAHSILHHTDFVIPQLARFTGSDPEYIADERKELRELLASREA